MIYSDLHDSGLAALALLAVLTSVAALSDLAGASHARGRRFESYCDHHFTLSARQLLIA